MELGLRGRRAVVGGARQDSGAFLASERASSITGQLIAVDGS